MKVFPLGRRKGQRIRQTMPGRSDSSARSSRPIALNNRRGSVTSASVTLLLNIVLGARQQEAIDFEDFQSSDPHFGPWQEFVPHVGYIHTIGAFLDVTGHPGPLTATLESLDGTVLTSAVVQ